MGRIGMSRKELCRVEVLARVKSSELKVVDAASLVGVSYRQAKRLWKRYREGGAQGLRHRSAGRASPRAKTGCGSTRRRCGDGCWRKGCGAGDASGNRIASGESDGITLGSWCRWTERVFTAGI